MSIILTDSSKLELTATAGTNIAVVVSYIDVTSTTTTAGVVTKNESYTGVTKELVGPPVAGTQRCIKHMTFKGAAATTTMNLMHYISVTSYSIIQASLTTGETLEWTDGEGWKRYDKTGSPVARNYTGVSGITVTTLDSVNSYNPITWSKTTSFIPSFVRVLLWGGGGGGGGGGSLGSASATVRFGGAGGGGGAFVDRTFRADEVGAYEIVHIGRGGIGGRGGASGAAGTSGAAGEASWFGQLAYAGGGGGGRLGAISALAGQGGGGGGRLSNGTTGAAAATATAYGGFPREGQGVNYAGGGATAGGTEAPPAYYGGGAGGSHTTSATSLTNGGSSVFGGGGGGHGASATSTPSVVAATNGGASGVWQYGSVTGSGGLAGSSTSTPQNGFPGTYNMNASTLFGCGGTGGGGGGGTVTANTNGGRGGNGGIRGGGGGGGGVGCNTGTGGAGGDGGNGGAVIITWS